MTLDLEIREYLKSLNIETSNHFISWLERRRMNKGTKRYVALVESIVEPSWLNLVIFPETLQYNHKERCIGKLEYSILPQEPWGMRIYSEKHVENLTTLANNIGERYHVPMDISFKPRRLRTYCWKEYREQPEKEK